MTLMMKRAVRLAALSAVVLTTASQQRAAAQTSSAQSWPERPVTMVVPFAAGGGTDLLGRIVGRRLSEVLGQQVIIENVGGAGGMVGSARVVKAPPDGYQFVVGTTADAINQSLYKNPLYNFATDLVPAGLVGSQPTVLLTRKDFPASNLQEFTAYAKAKQATLQFASAGTGSTGHLFCNLLNVALGINITHVPYRGGGPAMQDLIAGRTDYICTLSPTAKPAMDGDLVKAIAILSRERSPMLPDLPTAHEQGLTDFDVDTWFGLFFPRLTPEPIVRKLNAAIALTLDTPGVQDQLKEIVASVAAPDRRSPDYLRKLVDSETAKMGAAIRAAGIAQN
jgi:tripartite-type tricarboxylate transporter receptor subunit TctC